MVHHRTVFGVVDGQGLMAAVALIEDTATIPSVLSNNNARSLTVCYHVNSRGYRSAQVRELFVLKFHSDGPREFVHKAISLLEASPEPMRQIDILRKCGYAKPGPMKNTCSQSFFVCMTYSDVRVFETDDGLIGLVGVHDDVQ